MIYSKLTHVNRQAFIFSPLQFFFFVGTWSMRRNIRCEISAGFPSGKCCSQIFHFPFCWSVIYTYIYICCRQNNSSCHGWYCLDVFSCRSLMRLFYYYFVWKTAHLSSQQLVVLSLYIAEKLLNSLSLAHWIHLYIQVSNTLIVVCITDTTS